VKIRRNVVRMKVAAPTYRRSVDRIGYKGDVVFDLSTIL
jgi:hypothetical protein